MIVKKKKKYGRYEGLIIIRIIMRVCCTGVVYTRHEGLKIDEYSGGAKAGCGAKRCNRPNLD